MWSLNIIHKTIQKQKGVRVKRGVHSLIVSLPNSIQDKGRGNSTLLFSSLVAKDS
ncbi:hypothetical protein HN51_012878, partial [Arachis hypogaea]